MLTESLRLIVIAIALILIEELFISFSVAEIDFSYHKTTSNALSHVSNASKASASEKKESKLEDSVSILIASCNRPFFLQRALESIELNILEDDSILDRIIIDCEDSKEAFDIARKFGYRNLSASKSATRMKDIMCNIGSLVDAASTKFAILIEDDYIFEEEPFLDDAKVVLTTDEMVSEVRLLGLDRRIKHNFSLGIKTIRLKGDRSVKWAYSNRWSSISGHWGGWSNNACVFDVKRTKNVVGTFCDTNSEANASRVFLAAGYTEAQLIPQYAIHKGGFNRSFKKSDSKLKKKHDKKLKKTLNSRNSVG
mmetsp:Transcript_12630/g.18908  ORF Transcript_12630/g.18908 Transcript_12630/m.18908 type:complete len:310 (-) Transcript_12630:93-1022(-)